MSHHGDNHDRVGRGLFSKQIFQNKRSGPLKWLPVIVGVVLLLVVMAIITVIVLAVSATSLTISGIQQAVVELWQTVNGWFQPITDLYNRALKLVPGQE